MSEVEALVNELRELEPDYRPDPVCMEPLRGKKLVAVYGVSCVGKTTLIKGVVGFDPNPASSQFREVETIVTRPVESRDNGTTRLYVPHDRTQLELIRDGVKAGTIAQYSVHPQGYVYYTRPESYKGDYSLIDAPPQAHWQMSHLPFADLKEIVVVAPAKLWDQRFDARYRGQDAKLVRNRLLEGIKNLDDCLSRDDLLWVINAGDQVDPIARSMQRMILGEAGSDRGARSVGENLLGHLRAKVAAW